MKDKIYNSVWNSTLSHVVVYVWNIITHTARHSIQINISSRVENLIPLYILSEMERQLKDEIFVIFGIFSLIVMFANSPFSWSYVILPNLTSK